MRKELEPGTIMIHHNRENSEAYHHDEPGVIRLAVQQRIEDALNRLWEEEGKEPAELRIDESDGSLRITVFTSQYIEAERATDPDPRTARQSKFDEFIDLVTKTLKQMFPAIPDLASAFPLGTPPQPFIVPAGATNPIDYLPPDPRKFAHRFEPQIGDEINAGISPDVCRQCHGGKNHVIHQLDASPVQ